MKNIFLIFTLMLLSAICPKASADLSLQVKIDKKIGEKRIEVNQSLNVDFDKEIVINNANLKEKIILSFKKFKDITVNGVKINPIQVDMRMVNDMKKVIGKTQTATSFHNGEAVFQIPNGKDESTNLKLNFEEH